MRVQGRGQLVRMAEAGGEPTSRGASLNTMSVMRTRAGILALGLVVVTAVVLGLLAWWGTAARPGAQVVDGAPAPSGWKTIELEGVRVDIPSEWKRSDRGSCEFAFERWAAPEEVGCDATGEGVSFYVSATFDPAYGPGLRRADASVDAAWAGYAYAGDYAIYVSGDDRDLLAEVLRSARSA